MAQIHGMAGEWARVRGAVIGLWPLFLFVFLAGFSTALLCFGSELGVLALLVVAIVGICSSLMQGLRRTKSFFIGARGEERVSGILQALPDTYHVFNDFVACGAHVDHVVVGPAGVFALETKFWRGRVTVEEGYVLVDGRLPSRAPLGQVLRETRKVRKALVKLGWDGPVTPILVFASDSFRERIAEVQGVVIINSSEILRSFATERVVLQPADLDRLVSLMENNQ